MATIQLLLSDFICAFMWVWSGALIKLFVYKVLGLGFGSKSEIVKCALTILSLFFFAWLGKITRGGSYNPLTVLSRAISGNFPGFLLAVGARIPAQVIGSIIGVKLIVETFPEIGHGPRLNVDIHRGSLTEGLLTFVIVIIALGLSRNGPHSFFMKTWISSISKLSLHILGSDLTGGCMNPASATGWAYARGDHFSKNHIFVYCLAPIEATLLGLWIFRLLSQPQKDEEKLSKKSKSD